MKLSISGRSMSLLRVARPLVLLGVSGFLCASASAQPGMGGGPGGGMGGGPGGPGGGMGGFGGGPGMGGQGGPGMGGGRRGDRAQMREAMLKMQLERGGFTDATLQSTILTFAKTKETNRQALNAAAGALMQGLADENVNDGQVGVLFDTFTAALSAYKTQVATAEKQLDTQVKFSSNKRLSAVLTLAGVIGDATGYLGGGPGGGSGFGGGPGGMGGMRGGPDGGMGGPGGGPGLGGGPGGIGGPPPGV